MLGLLGAALAGAGQVAALHSVREGVGFSFFIVEVLALVIFSFFLIFFCFFFWFTFDYYMFIRNYQPATDSAE